MIILRSLLFFLIFVFYLWTATAGTFTFELHRNYINPYNALTNSFINGQLNLLIETPEGLLQLPDPYNPIANQIYRDMGLHDLALYKEKLYLYFSPTPVIILYLPYKLLTQRGLPDNLVVLIFTLGTLIFSVLLLTHMKNKYFPALPEWCFLLSIATVGFANLSPFLLRCHVIYEAAIAGGCLFLTGSVYFLCKAISDKKLNIRFVLLGSLFLGLALGTRLYLMFSALGIILLFIWNKELRQKLSFQAILALVIPFTLCLSSHLLYNYLRFDNPFENGGRYQISSFVAKPLDRRSVFPNLKSYLFQLPVIKPDFPFIFADYWRPYFVLITALERIVGLPFGFPFILLLLLCPYIYSKVKEEITNTEPPFPFCEFWIIFLPVLINFILLLTFQYVTMRYLGDYMTLLLLAASIVWFYFDSILTSHTKSKTFLRRIAVTLSTVTIIFGIAFSITGLNHGLHFQNPNQFKQLESFFKPVSIILSNILPGQ